LLPEKDLRELRERHGLLENEDLTGEPTSPPKAPVSRISQAQRIAKGGNLYDRREWSLFLQVVVPIGMVLVFALSRFPYIFLLIAVFIVGSIWVFITISSTRTTINEYGIHLQRAFWSTRQMFYYDEITKITFGKLDSSYYYYKNPEPKFKPSKFTSFSSDVKCTIHLKNGEYYYIWTEYEHEIKRALDKITPKLIIEQNSGSKE